MIGWSTSVCPSYDLWYKWLKSSECLFGLTDMIQLYFKNSIYFIDISDKILDKIQIIHPWKGGRLYDIPLLAIKIEKLLNKLHRKDITIILHPPKKYTFHESAKEIFKRIQDLYNLLYPLTPKIAIELTGDINDDKKFLETTIDLKNRIKEPRQIGFALDIEHQSHKRSDIPWLIKKFHPYIFLIHMKDYDGLPFSNNGARRFINYRKGNVDFSNIFKALRNIDIPLILEGKYKNITQLRNDLELLRQDCNKHRRVDENSIF